MGFRKSLRDLSSLEDEKRHEIFSFLHRTGRPASAKDVAVALRMSSKLARFHLEALLEKGLLQAHYSRTSGRVGPGAGRTSKLYQPAQEEVHASIPPRDYQLAASILVEAVATSTGRVDPKRNALRIARARGRDLARNEVQERTSAENLLDLLTSVGYEPATDPDGTILLTNCPFHQLAQQNRPLVCSINKAFVEGVTTNCPNVKPKLEPEAQRCCVVLEPIEPEREKTHGKRTQTRNG